MSDKDTVEKSLEETLDVKYRKPTSTRKQENSYTSLEHITSDYSHEIVGKDDYNFTPAEGHPYRSNLSTAIKYTNHLNKRKALQEELK